LTFAGSGGKGRAEVVKKMYAFLAELVPDAMRGKEMGSQGGMNGAFSAISAVIYEHVTITYSQSSNTITVFDASVRGKNTSF
jgi:hypothetical protein